MLPLEAVRAVVPSEMWSAATALARQGCVRVVANRDGEISAQVRVPGRPLPQEVHLWEDDWDCDCEHAGPACVHVAAAVIALGQASRAPLGPHVRHALRRASKGIVLERRLVTPLQAGAPETVTPLRGSLAAAGAWATSGDLAVEAALLDAPDSIPREAWPRVLAGLAEAPDVTLDGVPVQVSREPIWGVVRVEPDGDGLRVRLVRDPRIEEVLGGVAARHGTTLHPLVPPDLKPGARDALTRGVRYGPDEIAQVATEVLPALAGRVPLDIRAPVPEVVHVTPVLHLVFEPGEDDGLDVLPSVVYGDPPVARVVDDRLVLLGSQVPERDRSAEAHLAATCGGLLGVAPGRSVHLPVEDAVRFVSTRLPGFRGLVEGRELASRWRRVSTAITPRVTLRAEADGGCRVEVEAGGADPEALVEAWLLGRSLVPIEGGGFAPLPETWLDLHGWRLADLLAARDDTGRIPPHAVPSASTLARETGAEVPSFLDPLRSLAEDFQGLQAVDPPAGLVGVLRPYQRRGLDWLVFLRDAGLGGVLADDMGLGKTLQALAAMAMTPGPHLVVAPTSVLTGWIREARRFVPNLGTCLFHGPDRHIDPLADLVVTSYALLRRDEDLLSSVPWAWVVLDEAQAIKNPDSQAAAAARRLPARHRLALTGTPIENRLEELWSLFAFVLPGFLGSRRAFRTRLVASVEAGRSDALAWLRSRVRPFLLRRLKSDVAPELPPRTEMVIACEMEEEQRTFYEAIRSVARTGVRAALDAGRPPGVLEALLRLRQAACHPALVPGGPPGPAAKVEELVTRLVTLSAEAHRALVFSQWTSLLDLVEPALCEAGLAWLRIDGATRDRQAVVDAFQSPDGPPVLLLSLRAGGTGLNLTAADWVFHLDPWWNPAVEAQAIDRTHRIGQTRPVFACRLVASETVEERVLALQEAKRGLARAAVGDEAMLAQTLTRDEILALFD
ncbi:MAG: DEAD/DEAH box helicase [Deltaproteobacteria bacterium]|nr:DEAD/DEAH box helicase [Deltaproteobacteria bacterium]